MLSSTVRYPTEGHPSILTDKPNADMYLAERWNRSGNSQLVALRHRSLSQDLEFRYTPRVYFVALPSEIRVN